MFGKMKVLSAAVMAAGAMMAGGAFAVNVTDTPDIDLWVSGASAQDALINGMFPTLCTDTPIYFTDTAASYPGSDYAAYFCTMDSTKVTGISGAKKVMVHKRSAGGSAWGVAPVALAAVAGQSQARVDVAQMEISIGGAGAFGTTGNNCKQDTDAAHFICNKATLVNKISDAGVSDVEPSMFVGPNLIPVGADYGTVAGDAGTFPLTGTQLAKLSINPMSAVTFGVVVTTDLRNTLQKAQGKTVGSDAVDQMPSLTSTQIRSLFTGAVYDWSQFNALDTTSNTWLPLTDVAFHASNLNNTTVNVCRRDPGSGTQAQFNAHFLGAPCESAALTPSTDNSASSTHVKVGGLIHADVSARDDAGPGSPLVHEVSASGDLTQCLTELETTPTTGAGNGKFWGIGIQGVTSANANFRFVAVDGVTPTLNNVASGKYFDWAANTIQYRASADAGALSTALSGDKLKIVQKLISELSTPSLLDQKVNKANPQITGVTKVGALALSSKGFVPSTPFAVTNPVLPIAQKDVDLSKAASTCRKATLDGVNGVNLEIISATAN